MSRSAAEILEEIRQLPIVERDQLIESLLGEEGPMTDEVFAAWQREVGAPEPSYDAWFRKGVEEALANTSPDTPHEEVEQEIGNILLAARERKRQKQSA